ncbi:MAG: phosphate/phosphite/phosphonate ABC transporter substrate-binding protein [Alphaproteobacteria bacterium]|nr:phosphate/phosphite/phosphonate ABC transporter substrate-binding protein [Alphaproteobacteria bacterium]
MLAAALGLFASGSKAADRGPIEIAVLPYFSARTLFQQFEPLRAFIEEKLGRPTYLQTAPDYQSFVARTQRGEFGLVVTGPHLARLAQVEAGYQPLAQWKSPLRGVFVVRGACDCATLGDLRGRSVATPDRLAVTTMLGDEALRGAGLTPGVDIAFNPQLSHNAALLSVLRGEDAAALVWSKAMVTLDPELRADFRELAQTAELPIASVFMAGPASPPADVEALRAALLEFGGTPGGRDFLEKSGYEGIIPVMADELGGLDRYLPATRAAMGDR